MAEADPSGRVEATADELEVAYSGPAPGANKFIITIGQPGVRIAFTEKHPFTDQVFFRSAVTMHPVDAIALYKILESMLAGLEGTFQAIQLPSIKAQE